MDAERKLLTCEQAAKAMGLGQTTIYALVASGSIRAITVGRARRIPVIALDEFIARRLAEGVGGPQAPG